MLKSMSRFKEYVRGEYEAWRRATIEMSDRDRKALKELFSAALSASDSAYESANALPRDMMFMLMLIQLKARLDDLEAKLYKK